MLALTLLALALAAPDCAPVPLAADYWHPLALASSAHNNVNGALVLGFDASPASPAVMATAFASPQDLRAHSVLSFSVDKVVAPKKVAVRVRTANGPVFRSENAVLPFSRSSVVVDLAASDFLLEDANGAIPADAEFQPILGLAQVAAVELLFFSDAPVQGVQLTVENMLVCAHAEEEEPVASIADEQAAKDALEFPDVASLSSALSTALGQVHDLAVTLEEMRGQQRASRRAFDEFAAAARESIHNTVDALSTATAANVEQTLANAKLLQRLRERLDNAASQHEARLSHLDAQFAALSSLALQPGESLSEGVARVNAQEAHVDIVQLNKRAVEAEQAVSQAARTLAQASVHAPAVDPVVGDAFGATIKRKETSRRPIVKAPKA